MDIVEHLWVDEKVTAFSGTGNITLGGTPYQTGSRTFAATYATGDTLIYVARDLTTGDEECGLNTVTISAGVATITRTAAGVIESTNANGLVNFAGNDIRVFVDKAPGVTSSAGAADAGKVAILNAYGVPAGAPPLAGFIPSGTQTLVSPRNTESTSGNNFTVTANTWYRENVLWTFSQTPQYIGFWAQNGGTAGNCRLLIHAPDSSGNAGTLIYDSGTFATPTSFTTTFYPPTALAANSLPPGVYIFSYCFDSAFEINVSGDQIQAGAWTGLAYQLPIQKFTYAGAIGTVPPATQTGWSGVNPVSASGYRTAYFGKF